MESVNNTNLGSNNQNTPPRHTPISNNITQFLTKNTPTSSGNSPTTNMSGGTRGTTTPSTAAVAKEKKNARVKRSELDDDIEMIEEDSDADAEDDIVVVPHPPNPPPASGNVNQDVIDITADNDDNVDDDIVVPTSNVAEKAGPPKMKKVKKTVLDDEIEMIEEDDGESVEPSQTPEPYNTAETPPELRRSTSIMSGTERIVLTPFDESVNDINGSGAEERNSTNDIDTTAINAVQNSSSPMDGTLRVQKKRSSGVSIEKRKVHPDGYEYGHTFTNKPNGRLIVFEENDRQLCREYTICKNSWYCRFCQTVSKQRIYAVMNADKTFDVPVNHFCQPITYEEAKVDQERIKEKFVNDSRKRDARVFQDDAPGPSKITRRTRSPTVDRDNVHHDAELAETIKRLKREQQRQNSEVSGPSLNGSNREAPRTAASSFSEQPETSISHASSSNDSNGWNDFVEPSTPPSNLDSVISPQNIPPPNKTPSPPLNLESDFETNMVSSFRFYHASGEFLSDCCEKVGLIYHYRAYQFWANIRVIRLLPTSIPRITHTINANEHPSGFATISLLLTGSTEHRGKIKHELNKYFLQNSIAIGGIVGHDLSRTYNPKVTETLLSDDLTDIHFVALAHWFKCRIALFKNGSWKRFGEWVDSDSGEYLQMILLEANSGKYSPIFSF